MLNVPSTFLGAGGAVERNKRGMDQHRLVLSHIHVKRVDPGHPKSYVYDRTQEELTVFFIAYA